MKYRGCSENIKWIKDESKNEPKHYASIDYRGKIIFFYFLLIDKIIYDRNTL